MSWSDEDPAHTQKKDKAYKRKKRKRNKNKCLSENERQLSNQQDGNLDDDDALVWEEANNYTKSRKRKRKSKSTLAWAYNTIADATSSVRFWVFMIIVCSIMWMLIQTYRYQRNQYNTIYGVCEAKWNTANDILDNPVCKSEMEVRYSQHDYVNCQKAREDTSILPEACAHQRMWETSIPMKIMANLAENYGDNRFLTIGIPVICIILLGIYMYMRSQENVHESTLRHDRRIIRELKRDNGIQSHAFGGMSPYHPSHGHSHPQLPAAYPPHPSASYPMLTNGSSAMNPRFPGAHMVYQGFNGAAMGQEHNNPNVQYIAYIQPQPGTSRRTLPASPSVSGSQPVVEELSDEESVD